MTAKLRTIREATQGPRILRLLDRGGTYVGALIERGRAPEQIEGDDADDVWRRLHDAAARRDPSYFGFSGARARFERVCPGGFHGAFYAGHERDYKMAAKAKLDEGAPLERAGSESGLGEEVLRAYRATNMLASFEMMKMQDILRSPQADAFIRGAARFAEGDFARGLSDMQNAAEPHGGAKWTMVTYLPFFWRPQTHMFLKPGVTGDFARRVGHRFASEYAPRLDASVYVSLLDLAEATRREIDDFGPRDNIDIQSFIWIIGDYDEAEAETDKATAG